MPFYPAALEVLCNHLWLESQFAYRWTKYVRATLIQVESEEAETDIMASFWKVVAQPASNQRIGDQGRARSVVAEKFSKRAQMHFRRTFSLGQALHSCAPKILNQVAVFFNGFCDGRSPSLKTTFCLEKGQEGFAEIVPCLREIPSWGLLLGQAWVPG